MPPRVSGRATQSTKTKATGSRNPTKSKRRALNAFSIASHSEPSRLKIRQHRLGESDLGRSRHKRARDEDEEEGSDEDEGDETGKRKAKKVKGRFDELDIDEGSDSEGNAWKMGEVDEDDDSDIDSDEAFGESDEERFEGWAFRGSKGNQYQGKKGAGKPKKTVQELDDEEGGGDIDLDEEESADEEEHEDDLGEDAIDLATALDQYEDSEEEEKPKKVKKKASAFDDSEDEPSEQGGLGADGASDYSMSEDEDDADPSKIEKLKHLISSLPTEEDAPAKGTRRAEAHESATPSEFGVLRKVDISSFKPKNADPERKKALKLLKDDLKPSKRNDIARKLDAPLPKRQQDKLDRSAANEKANETLARWTDTVKHNRRAEHLSFPIAHPNSGESFGESRLQPTTTAAPANDLENTIQRILQQSGLSNGQEDEDKIHKWEELQINKLPLEEVQARRAELRKQRELLFREEVRARRVKKIKSKAYRRVHRKERERIAQREKDALRADGVDVSEDEREYNDRRRAEERMGAKHRESKWAKGMKESGRTIWDDDARAGVTEMARRNDELRRRIEGKDVRNEGDDGSDMSSEDESDDEEDGTEVLQRQLGRLKQNPFSTDQSKLGSMMFMQKAEAARKQRNDEEIETIRRELAGEETPSEEEGDNATRVGRRKFGPSGKSAVPAIRPNRTEFEERPGSDDEEVHEQPDTVGDRADESTEVSTSISRPVFGMSSTKDVGVNNPFLMKAKKEKKLSKKEPEKVPDLTSKAQDTIQAAQSNFKSKAKPKSKKLFDDDLPEPQVSAPDTDGWQTITYGDTDNDDPNDTENKGTNLTVVLRNQELTAKGFAGDDVEADFAAEKKATIEDEEDKVIDNTLPGWGSWVGEGLSKFQKSKNQGRNLVKQKGIQADKRKDAKLERVIINEKKVKKNTKYLAKTLPFPFESKEQYEKSLRLPKGPEWTTKKTFQDATKPRVIVKQGIIKPLTKPLV